MEGSINFLLGCKLFFVNDEQICQSVDWEGINSGHVNVFATEDNQLKTMISLDKGTNYLEYSFDIPNVIVRLLKRTVLIAKSLFIQSYLVHHQSSAFTSSTSSGSLILAFYIPKAAMLPAGLFLPIEILNWLFNTPSLNECDLSESFIANDFLQAICSYSKKLMACPEYTDSLKQQSIASQLSHAGLMTTLRPYQLQGVMWMYNNLNASQSPSDSVSNSVSSANSYSLDEGDCFLNGWIQVSESLKQTSNYATNRYDLSDSNKYSLWRHCGGDMLDAIQKHIESSILSDFVTYDVCLWYNLITFQITTGDALPTLLHSNMCLGGSSSCVLADEMGVGKSVQILGLLLLYKEPNDASSILPANGLLAWSELRSVNADVDDDGSKLMSFRRKKQRRSTDVLPPCFCERAVAKGDTHSVICIACRRSIHSACATIAPTESRTGVNYVSLLCMMSIQTFHSYSVPCLQRDIFYRESPEVRHGTGHSTHYSRQSVAERDHKARVPL